MVLHSRNCGILSTGLAVSSRRNDGIKQAGILVIFDVDEECLKNNIDRDKYKFEYEELALFMNWRIEKDEKESMKFFL